MKEVTLFRKIFLNSPKQRTRGALRVSLFTLIAIFSFSNILGQGTPPLPPPGDCVSQDLLVVEARLDAPQCVECEEGDEQSFPLILSINNKTGSFRPTFAFFGTLEVRDAEGNLISSETISGCNDTDGLLPNTITELPYPPIEYTCGTSLKITNLYLAWTDASKVDDDSSKNSCANLTTNTTSQGFLDISPKCGTLGEINVDTPLSGGVSSTDSSCFQFDDGELEALPIGGLAPYTYLWSNGETTKTITGLSPGTYFVTITDSNDCTYDTQGTVGEPTELISTVESVSHVSCNGFSDGAIDISVTGGTPEYTYLWNTGATTQDLSGIAAGTYSVTVTDTNGCTDTIEGIEVGEPDELVASVEAISDVSCKGFSDGAIDISVTGGTPEYTYLWNTGATTQDLSGIAAGTYSVTVTDANGCTDTIDGIEVGEPDELVASVETISDVSCNGFSDGAIDISVSGGTPEYTYLWNIGATTQDLSGIEAGTYSVLITDANGCIFNLNDIEIGEPDELVASVESVSDASCNGFSDGAIDISVTGGTPEYTYLWNTGATTQDLSGIAAGTYSVTVTDANGCTDTIEGIEVGEPDELVASVETISDVSCNGFSDGAIDISVTGGTPEYTYLWNTGATIQELSGIAAGTYSVTVTDANGCTDTIEGIEVGEPDELVASVESVTNATCNGELDGAIDISVTGGTPEYTYLWSNGVTTQDLSGVAAGLYSVTVTDANGCTDTIENIEIEDPSTLEAEVVSTSDVSCNGFSDGAIDISVTGGTPEYTYLWNTGATTQDLSGIEAGTYSVLITDANGCIFNLNDIEVGEPDELVASVESVSDASCNGFSDGAIDISVTGGTPEYTYLWNTGATTQDLSGIAAGTYSVTVTDANGCTDTIEGIEVGEPDELVASVETISDASCNGFSDGAIDISVTGGTPEYTYLWNTGATTQDLSGIAAGTYSVTVTDTNGCTDTIEGIEVGEPDELVASVESVTNATCNGELDGAIDISVTGGTPEYTYLWSNGVTTQDLIGVAAGLYSVTVTDANGCTDTIENIEIEDPSTLEAEVVSTSDVSCNGFSDGAIDISVSGGTPEYTYLWNTGATTQDLSGIEAGTYSVLITDANGCIFNLNDIEVGEPDELVASVESVSDASCNGFSDGAIDISVTGGTPEYTYLWNTGATTQDLSGIAAGTYSVTVTDTNGCTDTIDGIEVGEPDELVASVETISDASCNGFSDGAIDISVTGGTPEYTYLWNTGATTQDLSGIAAGTYSVTVTDANGCTDTIEGIEVGEPDELVASVESVTNATCNGELDGAIGISVTGGTPEYTYLWSNGVTTQDLSGVAAGLYSVTVTDANGCTDTIENIEIEDPSTLEAEVVSTSDVSCNGFSDGAIDISVSGGTPEYTYLWNTGATIQDLSGIEAGTYSVLITDANGCIFNLNDIEIGEPEFLEVDVQVQDISCPGFSDGKITFTASGGTAPYSSDLGDFNVDGILVLENLGPGTYGNLISDANGCTIAVDDIILSDPDEIEIPEIQTTQATCIADSQGSVALSYNPVREFYYSYKASGEEIFSDYFLYEGPIPLSPGAYDFKVKYSLEGCESEEFEVIILIPPATVFTLTPEIVQPDCDTGFGSIAIRIGEATELDTEFFNYTVSSGGVDYYDGVKQPIGGFTNLPPGDYVIFGLSDNECDSGRIEVTLEEPICENFEGCTLGYWKNHTDRWECYSTCTLYSDVFGDSTPSQLQDKTLLEVLNQGGGGIYNLGRQSVAALLNICNGDVNYEIGSEADLIAYVQENFSNPGPAGSYLDELNNAGCTLGGSRATSEPSEGCESTEDSKPGKGNGRNKKSVAGNFKASPVPFNQKLTLQYDFDYTSKNVEIQVFDLNGRLLRTYRDKKVSKGDTKVLDIDFALKTNQVYIIRMQTDREVITKNVVSSKRK
ncbi:hypothetical protein ML462_12070 [Gramella lutea]|uniref:Uncharacterized protein n=1 Tax=Christiangramia lutea TaxID=1607951 RepID=A0A9X1V4D6_9FLAO|nr:hypothetical protein [Christiangramia lutea]MCH4823908.1 hypothetical protein [Christiangramia lutea]